MNEIIFFAIELVFSIIVLAAWSSLIALWWTKKNK